MPGEDITSGCKLGSTCYGSILSKVNEMRAVFDQHGLSGKPMFDTEGSWGNDTITDPDSQAAWLAQFYLLQAGLWESDHLQFAAWFTWGDPATSHWGTIETTGGSPTQAGTAFNQVYAWLVGARMSQPCAARDGIWTCILTHPGGYRGLVVWSAGGAISYLPNASYLKYRNLDGSTVKIDQGNPVMVSARPFLFEN